MRCSDMRLIWILVLVVGVTSERSRAPAADSSGAASPVRPNVVFIISDDQGWKDYSFMGHPAIETPRLDRLAGESLLFRRGYGPSSLCCPSLASILTGRYPHQHKVTSNDPPLPSGVEKGRRALAAANPAFLRERARMQGFLENVPTLTGLLAQRGYLSFQAGKWWQGHFSRGGFTHGMTTGDPARGGRHGDDGLRIGRQTMQPMFDFVDLAVRRASPFFLWYAPMMPHAPHTPPARLLAKYQAKTNSIHVARYWAMVEWFDETCGQLLDHLERRQLATNTIVVYLADNGWIQDAQTNRYAPRSKQSPYDGGLRTPIFLRWPARVSPQDSPHLASSLDLMPTVAAAAQLPVPADLPGLNLLDGNAVRERHHLFGECFTHNAVNLDQPGSSLRWRWIIEDHHKLIVPAPWNETNGVVELFDLGRDPDELVNLASRDAARVRSMSAHLARWWSPHP
jgi:arylsulfatase A-like enzyme